MKTRIILFIIIFLNFSIFYPSVISAESELTVTGNNKQEIINERLKNTKERVEVKKNLIKEVQNTRQNIKENILEQKEKRETFRETLQAEREERKMKMEEMKESLKEKREAFKEKIETIKDERKKQLTEKIDNRMSTVNKNQTDRMTKALEKLTEHINKLENRVAQAKVKSVNILTIEDLIATAKTTISAALAIVEEQAAKDYAFTITDEKNLGQSVKASYDTLSQDLKKAQESLIKAKEAVVAAYKAAGTLEK